MKLKAVTTGFHPWLWKSMFSHLLPQRVKESSHGWKPVAAPKLRYEQPAALTKPGQHAMMTGLSLAEVAELADAPDSKSGSR